MTDHLLDTRILLWIARDRRRLRASGLAVATRDRAFFAYDGLEILEV